MIQARDQLVGRQHGAGRLVQAEEPDDVTDVLREHVVVATRKHGHRPRAKAAELGETGGVFKHVDRFEPDRTDREKLLEFQATRSTRLPEHLQRDEIVHGTLHTLPDRLRPAPSPVKATARAAADGASRDRSVASM